MEQDDLIGALLNGRYRVIRRIDKGAMGVVYEGIQEQLNKSVAIKVVAHKLITRPSRLRRFQREAEVLAALSHPNIAHVIDFFVHDECPIFVMELIKGPSLAEVLKKEKRLSSSRISHIASQILFALEATSEAQIVHRDLKPSNIMLAPIPGVDEWVKVVDFGIALIREETGVTRLTKAGEVLGTPNYMAPEQLLGKNVDVRADLYSLGAVMFRSLSGRTPYRVKNFRELLKAFHERSEPTVEDLAPFAPTSLSHVVIRALSTVPKARFETPRDMANALKRAQAGEDRGGDPLRQDTTVQELKEHSPTTSATGVTVNLKGQSQSGGYQESRSSQPEHSIALDHVSIGAGGPSSEATALVHAKRLQPLESVQKRRGPLVAITALLVGAGGAAFLAAIITGIFVFRGLLRDDQSPPPPPRGDMIGRPIPAAKIQGLTQPPVFQASPLPTATPSPPVDSLPNYQTMKTYLDDAMVRIVKLIPGYADTPRLVSIGGTGVDTSGRINIDTMFRKHWSFLFCHELSSQEVAIVYSADRENPEYIISTERRRSSLGACNDHIDPIDTLPDSDEVMRLYLRTRGCAVGGQNYQTINYFKHWRKTTIVTEYDGGPRRDFQAAIVDSGNLVLVQDCEGNRP